MLRDMKTTLTRLFTVMMLIMVSMGAKADVKVLFGENGDDTFKSDGGTIEVKQEASKKDATKITVYLIVTPNKGYSMKEKDAIEAYATAPANINPTRAPQASEKLTLDCDNFKDEYSARTYHVDIDPNLALWVKSADFKKKGENGAKFTSDYSGVYYIANKANYNSGTSTNNWYWVPAKDPQAPHKADAYFHNQYSTTDISNNNYDYTGDNFGDSEKPFVTTYKTDKVDNSIWIITPDANETSYYNIIHASTGKYLVYEPPYQQLKYRKSVHLETLPSPGNNAKFEITGTLPGPMEIKPKTVDSDIAAYVYLSVSGGNQNQYNGTPSNDYYRKGLIGLWNSSTDDCKWYFENAVVDKPTITYNTDTNTFTITTETNATIYYTTDGTTPTTTHYTGTGTTSVSLNQTATMTVIKAIAKRAGDTFPSVVTTYEIPQCVRPVITVSGGTVTITCATEGATIHYTTDGTPATSSSPTYTAPFAKGSATTFRAIATKPGYVNSSESAFLPPAEVSSSDQITNMSGNYILANTFSQTGSIGTSDNPFKGTIDGNMVTRNNFSYPLVAYAEDATIKNVILKDFTYSEGTNVGAICNEARGDCRIYNCGVLGTLTETKDEQGKVTNITSTSTISGSGYVGSIVGLLDGTSRVINCYSFATVSGGTMAAGIVGNNAQASTQSSLKTIVVNCMFYGDIKGGTEKYPVYGGNSINNDADDGINPYCYYRKAATFTPTGYNRSWPAEEKNLTRFEYYRSILNSNKKLCTWWVNGINGTAPTDDDVYDVGIAKWVLDPAIAPYPILKVWGNYPSVINPSPDKRVNPSTKAWVNRANASDNWGKHAAPDTEGQILGTVSVTINAGSHHSGTKHPTGSTSKSINITAMDTEYNDYCYGKIQLPYYNEVFGNPNGADHAAKYAGNYTDWVVTGWEVSGGSDAVNYNFADRSSYNGRVFAQGGFFYVPDGVESITITAHWGKAVYLANRGYSIDRVKVTAGGYRKADGTESKNFVPAGTIDNKFHNVNVYDDLQNAIKALGTSDTYPTVYDQAIVLIGNHQVKNGGDKNATNSIGYNLDSKWHPFTIMSADLDFDNEPDYCLQLQFRSNTDRPGIQPVRFDFLPVVELGLAVRHDKNAYAIGIFVPQGHFEITETSFMRTTQFEWDCGQEGGGNRIANDVPVILNGGEFDQLAVRYGNGNRTGYFLLGGHLWFHRFGPGTHPSLATANQAKVKLCPVNVIGGDYPEFYLSGLYRADITPRDDQGDPFCFIDGGNFGKIYGAGYEKINGNVTFKINHAIIGEFYGGGINGSNPIGGNIYVKIDNSRVTKYCGGPVVGDMTGKTVTTSATGTTFGMFYGGGNGGNSYYRQLQKDTDQPSSHIGTWNGEYNWQNFNPLNKESGVTVAYDNGTANKGFHAEYEFEVFNHSNGVPNTNGVDQITQRGFIRWIQFGITITGNVESTLTDCIVENNFYGGGNLATVDGTVTSTLKNTTVKGEVFGAGFSATIPTFQVHDKNNKNFPSIDNVGVITDGNIEYDNKEYTWTNDLNGMSEADRIASPTYSKTVGNETKWYCYTWNSLENLGVVTKAVILNLTTSGTNGKTTIGTVNDDTTGNVYGGGDASAVNNTTNPTDASTTVNISGNTEILGNVFGGGNRGLVSGSTTVNIE